jgi:tetratricopeptide (TPR) repeat protein
MATYWIDQESQTREDQRQAPAELTEVTGQLTALRRTYAPLLSEATGPELVDLNSNSFNERMILVAQAEQLVSENPSIVRATDYYVIGEANAFAGNYDRAYENFVRADQLLGDRSDYALALSSRRGKAFSLLSLDRVDQARDLLKSVASNEGFEDLPESVRTANTAFTLYQWTRLEAMLGHCSEARSLLERLESLGLESSFAVSGPQLTALSEFVATTCE